jgi:hypothetical protein
MQKYHPFLKREATSENSLANYYTATTATAAAAVGNI